MKHPILAILIAAAVLLPGCGISAAEPASNQTLQALDKMPEPVGGLMAIMQLVSYPQSAIKDGIEGKVLLTVIVDVTGKVKSVEVLEAVRSDLDKAAVKAMKQSKWIPAQKDGRPEEATVIVPIQFKLESNSKK